MRKPRLFIASSAESLNVAEAVNVNLDHDYEVTIWKNGTFKLTTSTIDDLVEKSSSVDFALFIFTPDDLATIRDQHEQIVRDNVLFELGLFIGSIGKDRCFLLKPRGVDLHLPTDLLGGIKPADYDANRSDGDIISSTNRACTLIKQESASLGIIDHASLSETRRLQANPPEYLLYSKEYQVLAFCLRSHTDRPSGLAYSFIQSNFKKTSESQLQLSLIKLVRSGLLEKFIETDHQYGDDYYCYSITDAGIDILLKNEDALEAGDELSLLMSQTDSNDIPF